MTGDEAQLTNHFVPRSKVVRNLPCLPCWSPFVICSRPGGADEANLAADETQLASQIGPHLPRFAIWPRFIMFSRRQQRICDQQAPPAAPRGRACGPAPPPM